MGHTSLVANEGCEVDLVTAVILGESLAFTPDALTSLLGQESQRAVPRRRKLSVTLKYKKVSLLVL